MGGDITFTSILAQALDVHSFAAARIALRRLGYK